MAVFCLESGNTLECGTVESEKLAGRKEGWETAGSMGLKSRRVI